MSMMHCSALQEVADMQDENFDIINCDGVDIESMRYLMTLDSAQRVEVLLQWIQRLVVNMQGSGVVTSPPPIVSRVFQELADGRMRFNAAKKIASFPFPFPYAQMLMVMLMIHWISAPVMASLLLDDIGFCAIATFVTSVAFWCINYIAAELEMPFGDNANDLPVEDLQVHFNASLARMMHPFALSTPAFLFRREFHEQVDFKKMSAVESFFLAKQDPRSSKLKEGVSEKDQKTTKQRKTARLSQSLGLKSNALDQLEIAKENIGGREGSIGESAVFAPKAVETSDIKPLILPAGLPAASSTSADTTATSAETKLVTSQSTSPDFQTSDAEPQDISERIASPIEAFDPGRMEERMAKIVQELVHLLVPAACNRMAEAVAYRKNWRPESEFINVRSPLQTVTPEPSLFQGGREHSLDDAGSREASSMLSLFDTSLLRPNNTSDQLRPYEELRPPDGAADSTICAPHRVLMGM
jgi:hypothetical protein